jgi:hypothetical protein
MCVACSFLMHPSDPAGKHRRLQFIECENDLNAMIDAAKFADLVLLLIDGGYGFEMETFEFLNILQVSAYALSSFFTLHSSQELGG